MTQTTPDEAIAGLALEIDLVSQRLVDQKEVLRVIEQALKEAFAAGAKWERDMR